MIHQLAATAHYRIPPAALMPGDVINVGYTGGFLMLPPDPADHNGIATVLRVDCVRMDFVLDGEHYLWRVETDLGTLTVLRGAPLYVTAQDDSVPGSPFGALPAA